MARDALCVWTNLGKVSLFVWLCVCSIKTATRRIMRLDELCSVIRLNRRTIDHSSSRRIMRVCVYKDGTQTNNLTKQDLDTKSQFKDY